MKRIGTAKSELKTPRQVNGPLTDKTASTRPKSQHQKVGNESKSSQNKANNNNATTEVKLVSRKPQNSLQLKKSPNAFGSGSISTRPSTSRVNFEQDFKVSNSTGSLGLASKRKDSSVSVQSDYIAPSGTNTSSSKDSRPLYKSHYWSKIDPIKYPVEQPETKTDPTEHKEKVHHDSAQLQKFMDKQKEIRRKQAKEEQEARTLEIAKKKQKLVALELTRRDLVRKFKTNPLLPHEVVEIERSKRREHEKLFAYRPPPPPAPRPIIKKTKKTPTKAKSNPKLNLSGYFPTIPSEDSGRSIPDPGASIRNSMILEEYRNIVQKEVVTNKIQDPSSAVLNNLESCGNALEVSKSFAPTTQSRFSIAIKDLAASKIQAAFRSYRIRKIQREIREREEERPSSSFEKTDSQHPIQLKKYKSPLRSIVPRAFTGRLGSPLRRLPQYHESSSSSSNSSIVNSSFVPELSRFEDVFPSELTMIQVNNARANSPNGVGTENSRRKSFESGNLTSNFPDHLKARSSQSKESQQKNDSTKLSVPKAVEELLTPVSTSSNVLKDKIRILQQKAEKSQKADKSSQSTKENKQESAAPEPEYIGPGSEAMEKAYKLRLSLQQAKESRFESIEEQSNKLYQLKLQTDQMYRTALENNLESFFKAEPKKEEWKLQAVEPEVLNNSMNLNLQQFIENVNKQELLVETVQVELDDTETLGSGQYIDGEAGSATIAQCFDELDSTSAIPNSSEFDALQYLESKKAAIENLDSIQNEISYYSELVSEVVINSSSKSLKKTTCESGNISSLPLNKDLTDLLSFEHDETDNRISGNGETKDKESLNISSEDEEKVPGESSTLLQIQNELKETSPVSSAMSTEDEAERILSEALALDDDSCAEGGTSSSDEDSIMKRMGMDYGTLQEYLSGMESEEEVFDSFVNDEYFQREASRLTAEQRRIEAEIMELQALEALALVDEHPITPPSPRPLAHSHGTEFYISPPSSAIEEPKPPALTCPIGKLEKFIDTKAERAWESWKSDEGYMKQEVELNELEINLPIAEARSSDRNKEFIEPSKESIRLLLNNVADDLIREALQLEPEDPAQHISLMDKVRPGRISFELRHALLPKSINELSQMIFSKLIKLIPTNILVSDETQEPVEIHKPTHKWTGRQKDRIDEVVADELYQMECEWKNLWPEEILVKNGICDKLIKRTVWEVLSDLVKTGRSIKTN